MKITKYKPKPETLNSNNALCGVNGWAGGLLKINTMRIVKSYTIEELCNENKKIIIKTQEGIELGLEPTDRGTEIYLYFGGTITKEHDQFIIKKEGTVKDRLYTKDEMRTAIYRAILACHNDTANYETRFDFADYYMKTIK